MWYNSGELGTARCREREGEPGTVFSLEQLKQKVNLEDLSPNHLYKLVGSLVDFNLVVLSDVRRAMVKEQDQASVVGVPSIAQEECSLLFDTLCIHGTPKLHARACSLLIMLCGSQPWWGSFVTSCAEVLYQANQSAIFHKERYCDSLSVCTYIVMYKVIIIHIHTCTTYLRICTVYLYICTVYLYMYICTVYLYTCTVYLYIIYVQYTYSMYVHVH